MSTLSSRRWTKPFELLDVASGTRRYLLYIRSVNDPHEKELPRGKRGRGATAWKKISGTPIEDIHPGLFELMSDGKDRTFNAICLELYGYTADVMAGGNVELAVWGQVHDGFLVHTFDAPVLFKQPGTLPLGTAEIVRKWDKQSDSPL